MKFSEKWNLTEKEWSILTTCKSWCAPLVKEFVSEILSVSHTTQLFTHLILNA